MAKLHELSVGFQASYFQQPLSATVKGCQMPTLKHVVVMIHQPCAGRRLTTLNSIGKWQLADDFQV